MIYAADFEGKKLYITANDAPMNLSWGPSGATGIPLYDLPSCSTGQANTAFLAASTTTYPAAEYCANLNAHGYGVGEWYLPSRHEFKKIYDDLNAAGKIASSNFQNTYYWTSSEWTAFFSFYLNFPNGHISTGLRPDNSMSVRCVTR